MPTLTRRAIPSESASARQRRGRSPLSTSRLDRRNRSTPTRPVASMTRVDVDPHSQNQGRKGTRSSSRQRICRRSAAEAVRRRQGQRLASEPALGTATAPLTSRLIVSEVHRSQPPSRIRTRRSCKKITTGEIDNATRHSTATP